MKICVMDLELNTPSKSIIEIGAACLDVKSGKIANTFRSLVDPNETIDPFITRLTGISQSDVTGQLPINAALLNLWDWMKSVGCQKTVAAWGNGDWHAVFEASKKHSIVYEHPQHLDIKVMASVLRCAFPNTKAHAGLANTLALFGMPFVGQQHRALDDAINTAKLLYKFKQMTEVYNQINSLMDK